MIETTKKDKETTVSLIRRFTRKVKQSSVLREARANRFMKRPLSDLQKKQEAIKRIKKENRREYLKKLGKIK